MPAVTPACPTCRRVIPPGEINVGLDVAYCRSCNRAQSLSELVHPENALAPANLDQPPRGTWFRRDPTETVIGASHRSAGTALATLGIALFWNGIVSVFVTLALASTLHLLGVRGPGWLPKPEMNEAPMGWGMTLFLWLFLTPFIAIGLGMIAAFLSALGGRTEIRIRGGEGQVFSGIGPVGWTRRFDPEAVRSVTLDPGTEEKSSSAIRLGLDNGKEFKVAFISPEERRRFVASALRQTLLKQ